MLCICKGNLLNSDCDVIAHQVNCQSVMGAGIALQIKEKYPTSYIEYLEDDRKPSHKLGNTLCCKLDKQDNYLFHLYGQLRYGRNELFTDYIAFESSVRQMIGQIKTIESLINKSLKVGLPYGIGCGLAGGDWKIIQPLLNKISFDSKTNIYLYRI